MGTGRRNVRHQDADVLVVGAGPTGLVLAGDLATAGVRVTVVDERPADLSNLTRAFAVHARSMEALDARGLADELAGTGLRVNRIRLFGHATVRLDGLPSRFPFVLVTPQYEVERVLRNRAIAAGAVFRHDTRVTAVDQPPDGGPGLVEAACAGPEGPVTLRGRWLVGTDGVRSSVRRSVGIPFPGRTVIRAMILADVYLADPPDDVLTIASRDGALGFLVPFGDGWYRFIGWDGERGLDDPVTTAEIRAVMTATLGDDHGLGGVRFADRFAADERQAPRYREGRVLLAGDAAHAHSPAGGLGMNTGMQDAVNLSWRLAAVTRGAPDAVLDGYEADRHPVGRQVLRTSGTILRVAVRPGPLAAVVRAAGSAVLTRLPAVRRRIAGTLSALDVAYPAAPGAHPRAGDRVPDLPLEPGPHGTRLAEALRAGRFVLVRPATAGPSQGPPQGPSRMPRTEPALSPGETDPAARVVVRRTDGRRSTLLVRPDGYLADALPG